MNERFTMRKIFVFLIVSSICFGLINCESTVAKKIIVDDVIGSDLGNPPENYTDLTLAIQKSSHGDVIQVQKGIYVLKDSLILNKSISLIGKDGNETILLLESNEDITKDCIIQIYADNVTVSYFKIMPNNLSVDGVRVFARNATITNNTILNTVIGMYLKNASQCLIQGNVFKSNSFTGIKTYVNTSNTVIDNNEFVGNYRDGLSLMYDYDTIIVNNSFINNYHFGINLVECKQNTISNNSLKENLVGGIRLSSSSNINVFDNNILNNNWCGVFFLNSCENTIVNNTINNHSIGVEVDIGSLNNIFDRNNFLENEKNFNISSNQKVRGNNGFSINSLLSFVFFLFLLIGLLCWIVFFIFLLKLKSDLLLNKKNHQIHKLLKKKVGKEKFNLFNPLFFNFVLFDKRIRKNKEIASKISLLRFCWFIAVFMVLIGIVLMVISYLL